jgi:hypothetical protein
VIFEILGGHSQALHLGAEPLQGALAGGGMPAVMIDVMEPQLEGLIELWEGFAPEPRQKLFSYGSEKSLMVSLP